MTSSDEIQGAQVIKERLLGLLCFLGVKVYELSVCLLKFLTGTENAGMMRARAKSVFERFTFVNCLLPFLEVRSLVFERVNHIAMYSLEALGNGQSFQL